MEERFPKCSAPALVSAVLLISGACGGRVETHGVDEDDAMDASAFEDGSDASSVDALWGADSAADAEDAAEEDGSAQPCVYDCWRRTSSSGLEPDTEFAAGAWAGDRALVYGGYRWGFDGPDEGRDTGAAYDPIADTWSPLAKGPEWASETLWTWTGKNLLALAPYPGSYDPAIDSWNDIPGPSVKWPASGMIAAGADAIVWSRMGDDGACGAYFDSAEQSWRPIFPSDPSLCRQGALLLWTGFRLLVWGGYTYTDGGSDSLVWDTGGLYDPATDSWVATTLLGAPSPCKDPVGAWTGTEAIVWCGRYKNDPDGPSNGAILDPGTNTWRPMNADGGATGSATWADGRMIVWSGWGADFPGGIYDPDTDRWTGMNSEGAPATAPGETMIWTGTDFLVWGGRRGEGAGWLYRPAPKSGAK